MADAIMAQPSTGGASGQAPGQGRADGEARPAEERVWARVQAARDPRRPHTLELLGAIATDVTELHGDRLFGDDAAVVVGFARLDKRPFVFVGHQKGSDTDENIRRNFGLPHPEGYRKAIRAFDLAERFRLPVVTFVDTQGAYPGAAAEERGVADAIARSIVRMTALRTPIVTVITGEGGSGGALAIAVGDVVLALENAVYSVISPEGCASILWRDTAAAQQAAAAMRMTAADQLALAVVDEVVPEPPGGAQADHAATGALLAPRIGAHLDALGQLPLDVLVERRYARYRTLGMFAAGRPEAARGVERPGIADRLRGLLEMGRETISSVGPPLPGRRDAGTADPDAPLREEL